ncbi:MAG: YlbF family regulator, partial [Bacillota bacterium]|nr:YlbF family regulator [Bacillota bacterium]
LPNAASNDLIRQYQTGQQEVKTARMNGRTLSEEKQQEFEALQKKVMGNTMVREYFESQQRFDQVIQTINQILQQAISGNSLCSSSGG